MGIISPQNGGFVQEKLAFSGSQLTSAFVEQHTATKEIDAGEFGKRGSVPLNDNKK